MEKKLVLVLLMVTLLAGGVFAQDKFLSAGFGLLAVPGFSELKAKGGDSTKGSSFDIGANLFFDVKFVEFNVGLLFGDQKSEGKKAGSTTNLTLGLLGKFPIGLGEAVTFFPFVGIDYNLLLAAKDADGKDVKFEGDIKKSDYSALSLLFGIGFDFNLTDALYLRFEGGYGIVFPSKLENDIIKMLKDMGAKDVTLTKGEIPIKLALGFRF